jgi:hypothetical protein
LLKSFLNPFFVIGDHKAILDNFVDVQSAVILVKVFFQAKEGATFNGPKNFGFKFLSGFGVKGSCNFLRQSIIPKVNSRQLLPVGFNPLGFLFGGWLIAF